MRSRALSTLLFLSILALAGCGSAARASLAPPLVFPTTASGPSGPAPLSVYVSANSQKSAAIYALNAQNGGRRWQYQSKVATGYPYVNSGVVYFGTADGKVYALDAGSGAVKWNYSIGSFPTIITSLNGVLYAGASSYTTTGKNTQPGPVYALNAGDGSLKWQSKNTGFVAGMDSSAIYLVTTDNQVVAVNISDGSLKWYYRADNIPSIAGTGNGQVYVITNPNQGQQHSAFYALNASDGSVQWRFPSGSENTAMGNIAVDSDTVYLEANAANGLFVYNANTVFALNVKDGSTRWQTTLQGTALLNAYLDSGTLYASASGGHVFALNTQDGSQRWSIFAGNGYPDIEQIDNGLLYVASAGDGLYALNTSDGSKLWRYQSNEFVGVYGIVNGIVYAASIPTQDPNGHSAVLGLNPADGSKLWSYDAGTAGITENIG
jgi:outer membrane protein assembly factor BamB